MLLELSVIPLGRGRSISADIVDLVKIIDASGLDYRLTAAGTIIGGRWDQLAEGFALDIPPRSLSRRRPWRYAPGISPHWR